MGGRYAGVAMGFINMIGCMGNTIQPYIGAGIFNSLGWNSLFGIYASAFLLAMMMWLFINPTRPFYDDRPQSARPA
jgi:MFS family permease